MSDASFFVAGGTVPPGSASYLERAADRELFDALIAGEFCFVLNSRQMGKSSLAVRTIAKLNQAGVRTAFVDLTRLGATGADPEFLRTTFSQGCGALERPRDRPGAGAADGVPARGGVAGRPHRRPPADALQRRPPDRASGLHAGGGRAVRGGGRRGGPGAGAALDGRASVPDAGGLCGFGRNPSPEGGAGVGTGASGFWKHPWRFSPTGDRLAIGYADGGIELLDAATWHPLWTGGKILGTPLDFDFSSDGRRLVVAADNDDALVLDEKTGAILLDLVGHGQTVFLCRFSHDGKRVVTASRDQTVRLWDAATGREMTTLGDEGVVTTSLRSSPDGNRLWGTTEDGQVRVWSAETGR